VAASSAEPRASVALLTANRLALLRDCLASLAAQTLAPAEVVVVDNGSTDGTAEFLSSAQAPFPIRTIRRDGTGSFAEARNAAAHACTGGIVAFIDDDCEADRHWLARLAAALHSATAAGGAVLPAEHAPTPDAYHPDLAWAVGLSPPGFFGPEGGTRFLPQAANLAFRREALARFPFQSIGGELGKGANYETGREDAEWWTRLRDAGEPLAIEPRAIVWHHIPRQRYRISSITQRAEADGRARWRRERRHADIDEAAADVVALPERLLRGAAERGISREQNVARHTVWAKRQLALLGAAVDDRQHGVEPTARALAYAKAAIRQCAGHGKALARILGATAWDAAQREPGPAPTPADPPRRLVAVLHPYLGDAVLALPLFRQLAEAFPRTALTLLASGDLVPLFTDQLDGWAVRAIPGEATGRTPGAGRALYGLVRRFDPDALLLTYLHGLQPLALLTATAGHRIGWPHDNGTGARVWGELLTLPVHKPMDQPEVTALLNLGSALGIVPRLERPTLRITAARAEAMRARLSRLGIAPGTFAAIHVVGDRPDGHGQWKHLPTAAVLEVARHLAAKGLRPVLVGGRADRAAADDVAAEVASAIVLHGAVEAADLPALFAQAALFVGGDSGPQHVAAAAGCRSIVAFGATDPVRWGPVPGIAGDPREVVRMGRPLHACDGLGARLVAALA
jgi:ADP-heptose:LPS heptosyltransferase/GT2 family glycosyltransferase